LNSESGFKLQHDFPIPRKYLFNEYAAKGTPFYSLITENHIPFYIDRLAGGTVYWLSYTFDKALIEAYKNALGDEFLGFQLHESVSNRRNNDWGLMRRVLGEKSRFTVEEIREKLMCDYAFTDEGEQLVNFSQGTPEEYAALTYAETVKDYETEIRNFFASRMEMTANCILPVDSGMLFTKMQDDLGMKVFMHEIGQQISLTRLAVALARGIARGSHKRSTRLLRMGS